MLLKFYAREGLVREPGCVPAIGQPARYLGRTFVPASKVGDKTVPAANPATEEGFECESDSEIAAVAVKGCRKGAFWPANEETAEFCGVPFVSPSFADGVWSAD